MWISKSYFLDEEDRNAQCESAEMRVAVFSHAARALWDQVCNKAGAASPDLTCAATWRSGDRDKFLFALFPKKN